MAVLGLDGLATGADKETQRAAGREGERVREIQGRKTERHVVVVVGTETDYGGQKGGEAELYRNRERKRGVEGDKHREEERGRARTQDA